MGRAVRKQVGELIEDMSLYPRRKISDQHVLNLMEALRAGAELPNLVVDAQGRIVDGFHRRRAYEKVYGPTHKASVEVRSYADDVELFLDAARLNATHGQKLMRADEIRVTLRAMELGADEEDIATALNVRPERVQKLRLRVVINEQTQESLPSKLVVRHLEGTEVTPAQAHALDRGSGVAPLRVIGDLTEWLRTGIVNLDDPRIRRALEELEALITASLAEEAS